MAEKRRTLLLPARASYGLEPARATSISVSGSAWRGISGAWRSLRQEALGHRPRDRQITLPPGAVTGHRRLDACGGESVSRSTQHGEDCMSSRRVAALLIVAAAAVFVLAPVGRVAAD